MVAIRQNLVSTDKWNIKCPYSMTPEYITIHNTANDASANNEIAYMIRNDNYVSFHFAVDDIEAVQGLLLNRNGWHAGDGDGAGNRKTIGIEICYSLSGGDRFTRAEINGAELTAQLLRERGWGIDRVKKHQDWSGKYCPHRTLDLGWDRFLNMVKAKLNPSVPVPNAIKLDKPQKYTMNFEGVNLWKLETNPNYQSAKQFAKGEKFEAVAYIPFNNTKYMISDYSFARNIKNGVNVGDMTLIPEPVVTTKDETLETIIPFEKITQNDPTKKTTEVTVKGVEGKRVIIYGVTYTDGKETSRIVKSDITTPPVTQVTTIGTYEDEIPNWFIKFWEKVIKAILSALGKGEK